MLSSQICGKKEAKTCRGEKEVQKVRFLMFLEREGATSL